MRTHDGSGDPTQASTTEHAGVVTIVLVGAGAAAIHPGELAAVITSVSALVVAGITWFSTNQRQRAVLKAERDKLTEELADQRERLARQLAHERQLDDRRELRVRIDTIAGSFEAARKAVREAYVACESAGLSLNRGRRALGRRGVTSSAVGEAIEAATEECLALFAAHRRLTLWLSEDDPAARALDEAAAALQGAALALSGADAGEFEARYQAASQAFEVFVRESRRRVQPDAPAEKADPKSHRLRDCSSSSCVELMRQWRL